VNFEEVQEKESQTTALNAVGGIEPPLPSVIVTITRYPVHTKKVITAVYDGITSYLRRRMNGRKISESQEKDQKHTSCRRESNLVAL
jgi:hypothetical protein